MSNQPTHEELAQIRADLKLTEVSVSAFAERQTQSEKQLLDVYGKDWAKPYVDKIVKLLESGLSESDPNSRQGSQFGPYVFKALGIERDGFVFGRLGGQLFVKNADLEALEATQRNCSYLFIQIELKKRELDQARREQESTRADATDQAMRNLQRYKQDVLKALSEKKLTAEIAKIKKPTTLPDGVDLSEKVTIYLGELSKMEYFFKSGEIVVYEGDVRGEEAVHFTKNFRMDSIRIEEEISPAIDAHKEEDKKKCDEKIAEVRQALANLSGPDLLKAIPLGMVLSLGAHEQAAQTINPHRVSEEVAKAGDPKVREKLTGDAKALLNEIEAKIKKISDERHELPIHRTGRRAKLNQKMQLLFSARNQMLSAVTNPNLTFTPLLGLVEQEKMDLFGVSSNSTKKILQRVDELMAQPKQLNIDTYEAPKPGFWDCLKCS